MRGLAVGGRGVYPCCIEGHIFWIWVSGNGSGYIYEYKQDHGLLSLLEGCAFLKENTDELFDIAILEDVNDTQKGVCTEQHLNQVESQVKLEPPRINTSKSTLSSNAECH